MSNGDGSERIGGLAGFSSPGTTEDFKLLVDPALRMGASKVVRWKGVDPHGVVACAITDPRPMKFRYGKSEPAFLSVPVFKVDENYVFPTLIKELTFTNLNDNINHSFLNDMCQPYGTVVESAIMYHPTTKKHLGIGMVMFTTAQAAENCLRGLNGSKKMGNVITVLRDHGGVERAGFVKAQIGDLTLPIRPPSPKGPLPKNLFDEPKRLDHHRTSVNKHRDHRVSSSNSKSDGTRPRTGESISAAHASTSSVRDAHKSSSSKTLLKTSSVDSHKHHSNHSYKSGNRNLQAPSSRIDSEATASTVGGSAESINRNNIDSRRSSVDSHARSDVHRVITSVNRHSGSLFPAAIDQSALRTEQLASREESLTVNSTVSVLPMAVSDTVDKLTSDSDRNEYDTAGYLKTNVDTVESRLSENLNLYNGVNSVDFLSEGDRLHNTTGRSSFTETESFSRTADDLLEDNRRHIVGASHDPNILLEDSDQRNTHNRECLSYKDLNEADFNEIENADERNKTALDTAVSNVFYPDSNVFENNSGQELAASNEFNRVVDTEEIEKLSRQSSRIDGVEKELPSRYDVNRSRDASRSRDHSRHRSRSDRHRHRHSGRHSDRHSERRSDRRPDKHRSRRRRSRTRSRSPNSQRKYPTSRIDLPQMLPPVSYEDELKAYQSQQQKQEIRDRPRDSDRSRQNWASTSRESRLNNLDGKRNIKALLDEERKGTLDRTVERRKRRSGSRERGLDNRSSVYNDTQESGGDIVFPPPAEDIVYPPLPPQYTDDSHTVVESSKEPALEEQNYEIYPPPDIISPPEPVPAHPTSLDAPPVFAEEPPPSPSYESLDSRIQAMLGFSLDRGLTVSPPPFEPPVPSPPRTPCLDPFIPPPPSDYPSPPEDYDGVELDETIWATTNSSSQIPYDECALDNERWEESRAAASFWNDRDRNEAFRSGPDIINKSETHAKEKGNKRGGVMSQNTTFRDFLPQNTSSSIMKAHDFFSQSAFSQHQRGMNRVSQDTSQLNLLGQGVCQPNMISEGIPHQNMHLPGHLPPHILPHDMQPQQRGQAHGMSNENSYFDGTAQHSRLAQGLQTQIVPRQSLSSQDLVAMASLNIPVEEAGGYWNQDHYNPPPNALNEDYSVPFERQRSFSHQQYYHGGRNERHFEEERWKGPSVEEVIKGMQTPVWELINKELRDVLKNDLIKKMVIVGYQQMDKWHASKTNEYEERRQKEVTTQAAAMGVASKSSQVRGSNSLTSVDVTSREKSVGKENKASGSHPTSRATDAVTSTSNAATAPLQSTFDYSYIALQELMNKKKLIGGLLGLRGAAPKLPSFRKKDPPATSDTRPVKSSVANTVAVNDDDEYHDAYRKSTDPHPQFRGPRTPEGSENEEQEEEKEVEGRKPARKNRSSSSSSASEDETLIKEIRSSHVHVYTSSDSDSNDSDSSIDLSHLKKTASHKPGLPKKSRSIVESSDDESSSEEDASSEESEDSEGSEVEEREENVSKSLLQTQGKAAEEKSPMAVAGKIKKLEVKVESSNDKQQKVGGSATKPAVKERPQDIDVKSPVVVLPLVVKSPVAKSPAVKSSAVTQNWKKNKRLLPDDFDSPSSISTTASSSQTTKKIKLAEDVVKSPKPSAATVASESCISLTKLDVNASKIVNIGTSADTFKNRHLTSVDMLLAAAEMKTEEDSPVDILTEAGITDEELDDDKDLVDKKLVDDILPSDVKCYHSDNKVKEDMIISVDDDVSAVRRATDNISDFLVSDVTEEVCTNSLYPLVALDHSYSAPAQSASGRKGKKSRGRPRKSMEYDNVIVEDGSDDDTVVLSDSAIGLVPTAYPSIDHTYCHPYQPVPDPQESFNLDRDLEFYDDDIPPILVKIGIEEWLESVPDIASECCIGQEESETVDVEWDQDYDGSSEEEPNHHNGKFACGDNDWECLDEKRRKLADVTNHRVGCRELANLLPAVVPTKLKFVERPPEITHAIVMDVVNNGVDTEDTEYLKQAFQRLSTVGIDNLKLSEALKKVEWKDHPVTYLIDEPRASRDSPHSSSSRKKSRKYQQLSDIGASMNKSGCARSEGYSKCSHEIKYLKRAREAAYEPIAAGLAVFTAPTDSSHRLQQQAEQQLARIKQQTRDARLESRRLQNAITSSLGDECVGDLLKCNQLQLRKKKLKFARSGIHDWGLFTCESVQADEMVIEYVGEVVRHDVANVRERRYESVGIGSSYLFRVDRDLIVDATKLGNLSRFINHSCNPNCYAKIITVDSVKKIVIYSKQSISKDEEITYDYKFPLEADKIPCLCGSTGCRGTLN